MRFARVVRLWLLAWLASAAFWMVLTDSVRVAELVAGVGVAALAATALEVVRRQRVAEQGLHPVLLLRGGRALLRILPDVGRLTRAAFAQLAERKESRGVVVALPFAASGDDPESRARRAAAERFGSIAPNTLVVGVDPDSGLLLAHQLEATRKPSDLDPLGLR